MKIAICISGFLRTWELSKTSLLKNLIQDHDYDLFIHTYNQNYFEYSSGLVDQFYSEEEIYNMFTDFNLKKLVIEDRDKIIGNIEDESYKYKDVPNFFIKIKESSDNSSKTLNLGIRIYDQLRKYYLVNKIRKEYQIENNIDYDFYVKTRFDILYLDKINWSNFTDENIVYNGIGGTAGFPDDLIGIGKELPINSYMDRFINLDKMCFSQVHRNDIKHINWYPWHGDRVFPIKEFCAHDTLLRNIIYSGFDIRQGGFNNRVIRNENTIVQGGLNTYFDIKQFNKNLFI